MLENSDKFEAISPQKSNLLGVLLINIHFLVLCVGFLLAKVVYLRNPDLLPVQLLLLRSAIGFGLLSGFHNPRLFTVMW